MLHAKLNLREDLSHRLLELLGEKIMPRLSGDGARGDAGTTSFVGAASPLVETAVEGLVAMEQVGVVEQGAENGAINSGVGSLVVGIVDDADEDIGDSHQETELHPTIVGAESLEGTPPLLFLPNIDLGDADPHVTLPDSVSATVASSLQDSVSATSLGASSLQDHDVRGSSPVRERGDPVLGLSQEHQGPPPPKRISASKNAKNGSPGGVEQGFKSVSDLGSIGSSVDEEQLMRVTRVVEGLTQAVDTQKKQAVVAEKRAEAAEKRVRELEAALGPAPGARSRGYVVRINMLCTAWEQNSWIEYLCRGGGGL